MTRVSEGIGLKLAIDRYAESATWRTELEPPLCYSSDFAVTLPRSTSSSGFIAHQAATAGKGSRKRWQEPFIDKCEAVG
jgi:hypothetical protein